ncbi:hypothetical protein AAY473_017277 [Plecturocebus cupreus]
MPDTTANSVHRAAGRPASPIAAIIRYAGVQRHNHSSLQPRAPGLKQSSHLSLLKCSDYRHVTLHPISECFYNGASTSVQGLSLSENLQEGENIPYLNQLCMIMRRMQLCQSLLSDWSQESPSHKVTRSAPQHWARKKRAPRTFPPESRPSRCQLAGALHHSISPITTLVKGAGTLDSESNTPRVHTGLHKSWMPGNFHHVAVMEFGISCAKESPGQNENSECDVLPTQST